VTGKPVPLALTTPSALRIIQEAAQESGRIFFTSHAIKRMRQRRITRTQVIECLRKGRISESSHRDIKGDWKCNMTWLHAGDNVTATVVIKRDERTGNCLLVITVFGG